MSATKKLFITKELFIRRVQDEGTALATEGPSTDRPLLCFVFLAIYHIRQMHTQTCTLQHMHAHLCTQWIQKKVCINRASWAEMRARWQFRIKYFHSAAGSNKMLACFTVTVTLYKRNIQTKQKTIRERRQLRRLYDCTNGIVRYVCFPNKQTKDRMIRIDGPRQCS